MTASTRRRQLDRFIGVSAGEVQLLLVIVDLEVGELEPVGRGDDHHMLGLVDLAGLEQLDQRSQGDAGVRAVEHAGGVAERGRVGQFLLRGVHDDAVELLRACGSPSEY